MKASHAVGFCLALIAGCAMGLLSAQSPPGPCGAPNSVVCENLQPGSPPGEWDVRGAGDSSLQGFATEISVNHGETVHFKIQTGAVLYRLDIYRLGYYGGLGARKVAVVRPLATVPQFQPGCLNDPATGLIDCGNWGESAAWTVPPDAVSGIYLARLVRMDTGGASHIPFIVRADESLSDLLFQTSDTTWQAYNNYGGTSLYVGRLAQNPHRAFKASYNRPFATRAYNSGVSWLFNAEYPMVRWLEANGYDVSYNTGVDTDRRGDLILRHKVFLSVGHDEYWSGAQRANVEAARAAGVHLAFFSGNEVYWKTRWEPSIDGSKAPHRTLVCYKETQVGRPVDPADPPVWTGTWRDSRFSPPADGGRPENALTGTLFVVDGRRNDAITVPADFSALRFWRNTSIARLAPGTSATLPRGTLGYEWDEDRDNGFRPNGLFPLSSTTVNVTTPEVLLDDATLRTGPGRRTHGLTLYRHRSGALVFGAGTVQWAWGLDAAHDNGGFLPDRDMQQATANLLADMGVQPGTPRPGLVPSAASTDTTAPSSSISAPLSGSTVESGKPLVITGTATDIDGVVAGVEVAIGHEAIWRPIGSAADIGKRPCARVGSWHRASGRDAWSYSWVPQAPILPTSRVTIWSRAVDDSGNLEEPCSRVAIVVMP